MLVKQSTKFRERIIDRPEVGGESHISVGFGSIHLLERGTGPGATISIHTKSTVTATHFHSMFNGMRIISL